MSLDRSTPGPAPAGRVSAERLRLLHSTQVRDVREGRIVARDWDGEAPASSSQQAMWFLHRLLSPLTATVNTAHDLLVSTRITGPLDVAVLRRALTEIVDRHAVLRTTFGERDGRPVQRVRPAYPFELPEVDLTDCAPADRDEVTRRYAVDEVALGFDITEGPLLRGRLLRFAPDRHVLLVVVHHIVFDGVSGEIFLRELGRLYEAFADGRPSPLPPLPIQFFDYAAWEQEYLTGGTLDALSEYWRSALDGADGVLDLPGDRPRPPVPSPHGAEAPFLLDDDLTRRLQRFGRDTNTTLYVVLLAALQTLLARWSGQRDLLVGACYANRRRPETENLIGFLVNTLVMRADFGADPSFRRLVEQVRETAMRAFDHREMPFDMVVKEVRPDRSVGFNPLFQVMYVYQGGAPTRAVEPGRLSFEWLDIEIPDATFDIVMVVDDEPDRISGKFRYTTDLYDAATMARFTRHYATLLDRLISEPDRPVFRVPLPPDDERDTVLAWSRGPAAPPIAATVPALVARAAATHGDRTAVTAGAETLTYRALDERANRLANHLRSTGVGRGDIVGVHLHRGLDLPVAVLAVLRAGAAYLPLDVDQPPARLGAILAQSRPAAVLTVARLLDDLPETGAPLIALDREAATVEAASGVPPEVALGPDDLAYVLYTSGSTGRPKGAMNTHGALSHQLAWVQDAYPLAADDRLLHKTPIGFDVSVRELLWPLVAGAGLVMAEPGGHRDPKYLARLIDEERVTVVHFVPAMLGAFLDGLGDGERCRGLRRVICSGEVLTAGVQRRYAAALDAPLINFYGPAEAAIDVSHWPGRPGWEQAALIGTPIAGARLLVLDDHLQPQPIGVPGELYIGGPPVGRGYLAAPGATAQRFLPDPYGPPGSRLYRTGDVARWTRDGELEFVGRADFQIKIRGYRIEPGEVEAALLAAPGVREAVVVARDDAGDPRLIAYVVPDGCAAPAPAMLRQVVAERLPEYMVPAVFVPLAALPLNPNGKVDRSALPAPTEALARPVSAEYAPPETPAEEAVAKIWAEVLGVERVGRHDDFFELGGHSLSATQAVARMREQAILELPVSRIFLDRSIARILATPAAGS